MVKGQLWQSLPSGGSGTGCVESPASGGSGTGGVETSRPAGNGRPLAASGTGGDPPMQAEMPDSASIGGGRSLCNLARPLTFTWPLVGVWLDCQTGPHKNRLRLQKKPELKT